MWFNPAVKGCKVESEVSRNETHGRGRSCSKFGDCRGFREVCSLRLGDLT